MKTDKRYSGAMSVLEQTPTILMDDLVHLVDFKRAIMKIDIEGQEVPSCIRCNFSPKWTFRSSLWNGGEEV